MPCVHRSLDVTVADGSNQLHTLPDGRLLDWIDYGDADGYPVFWFHGFLSSNVGIRESDAALRAADIRVIAVNRPGIGASTADPSKRTLDDHIAEIAGLADSLGIEQFGVIGYSGASIYALQARATLGDRVAHVAMVSAFAPAEMPKRNKGASPMTVVLSALSHRTPFAARAAVGFMLKTSRSNPDRFIRDLTRGLKSPADGTILGGHARDETLQALGLAGQSGPGGIVADIGVVARARDTYLRGIGDDVRVWHGDEDAFAPIAHGRWLADRLPARQFTAWPNSGHLRTPDQWVEVCQPMLG